MARKIPKPDLYRVYSESAWQIEICQLISICLPDSFSSEFSIWTDTFPAPNFISAGFSNWIANAKWKFFLFFCIAYVRLFRQMHLHCWTSFPLPYYSLFVSNGEAFHFWLWLGIMMRKKHFRGIAGLTICRGTEQTPRQTSGFPVHSCHFDSFSAWHIRRSFADFFCIWCSTKRRCNTIQSLGPQITPICRFGGSATSCSHFTPGNSKLEFRSGTARMGFSLPPRNWNIFWKSNWDRRSVKIFHFSSGREAEISNQKHQHVELKQYFWLY